MKKLFISCPMRGRTEENIKHSMERMHKVAELVFDQELEVIPTYIEDNPPKDGNQAIWFLGESIKKMAEADYYIGVNYSRAFPGCEVENHVAEAYDIPTTQVRIDEFMPDAYEIEQEQLRRRFPDRPYPAK